MPCSSQDVQGLVAADLVTYLETHSFNCVWEFIWLLDANIKSVLSTQHVMAVFDRIKAVSPAYQGTAAQHLEELLQFVHAAYWHKYAHPNDPALFNPVAVVQNATDALDAFIASPSANAFNTYAAGAFYEWLATVDGASLTDRYFSNLKLALQDFVNDPNRQAVHEQRVNTWTVFNLVSRAVDWPAFAAKMDQAMIDVIRDIALLQNLVPNATYVVNNAIYALGRICKIAAWKVAVVTAVTDVKSVYPPLSEPYLWAITALECNNCFDANGQKLCKSDVVPQLEAQLFPNTFVFDDGAITVCTPLPLADIQILYHAIKQVEAQFNRVTETIAPLPGDPNGVLKIVLYGTKADYVSYQSWLYGLDTNNGGIYIEQTGTFYTFQRTPQESIYPLEELMRHEYSHYLVGRFLIGGFWGQVPIYANERLTWFDEGFAEFLTWSTPRNGVKVRKRLVQLVAGDGPNGRMTVSQILSVTYGNFNFYRYAGLLFAYWFRNDLATLMALLGLVRAADVPGFDALIAQLKVDAALETAYQQFLDGLVAGVGGLDDPQTAFPSPNGLDEQDPAQIELLVRDTRLGYLAEGSVAAATLNTRFSCRGYLSGALANQSDPIAAWKEFDAGLNEIIGELEPGPPNNFQGLVGRFGRIRFVDYSGQVYPQADYFLDGPLAQGQNALLLPAAQVTADFHATRLGKNAVCTLINPGLVECTLQLTTRAHNNAIANSVLEAELAGALDELRNQVYAIRPPYYRSFECSFTGPAQVLPYTQQQKYMLRPVLCQVHLA